MTVAKTSQRTHKPEDKCVRLNVTLAGSEVDKLDLICQNTVSGVELSRSQVLGALVEEFGDAWMQKRQGK